MERKTSPGQRKLSFSAGVIVVSILRGENDFKLSTTIHLCRTRLPRPALRSAISHGNDSTYIYIFNPDYRKNDAHDVLMEWRVAGPKTVEIPWLDAVHP